VDAGSCDEGGTPHATPGIVKIGAGRFPVSTKAYNASDSMALLAMPHGTLRISLGQALQERHKIAADLQSRRRPGARSAAHVVNPRPPRRLFLRMDTAKSLDCARVE
jgi:hypothetical protein